MSDLSRATVGPVETFSRGPAGENIIFFEMAHSDVLYISQRRWAPKRLEATLRGPG